MTNNTDRLRAVPGRIHHTETFGAVDGPGIRFVFFLQGCPLGCLYCHNPDSRPFQGGETWTAGRAADEVLRYRNFISSGGVTFSGGEPLAQAEFVYAVTALLAEHGVKAAIDTSGCISINNDTVRRAIDASELILLDVKAADDETAKRLTGQSLKSAYETLGYCEATGKDVWVRHVLLAGYTLDGGMLSRLAERISKYKCVKLTELLPFHKLGEHKWKDTGYEYLLTDTPATTREQLERAKDVFRSYGLKVQ